MIELDPQHDRFIQPLMTTLEAVADSSSGSWPASFPRWSRSVRHVSRYRGKMLRPTLTLLSGVAAPDGDIGVLESEDLRRLSAVFEMIHMATLVHDDVLDEADHRRGGETVNRLNDNETAVMLGRLPHLERLPSRGHHRRRRSDRANRPGHQHALRRRVDSTPSPR